MRANDDPKNSPPQPTATPTAGGAAAEPASGGAGGGVRKADDHSSLSAAPGTLFGAKGQTGLSAALDNMPKVPFNEERYAKALSMPDTLCSVSEGRTGLVLARLHAPRDQPGSGFGAAKFRELVARSMTLGLDGKITTTASTSYGSPHLFYLYMGMEPEKRSVNYVNFLYGNYGEQAIQNAAECSSPEELEKMNVGPRNLLHHLKLLLGNELKKSVSEVTNQDILDHRQMLSDLSKKELDFVKDIFIPDLLSILEKNPANKYPNTQSIGAMHMHLSETGFERWKYCIESKLEFTPFRHLEHLGLSPEHQQKLDSILEKRASQARLSR